jgi:anti-sigma-K factor RskA
VDAPQRSDAATTLAEPSLWNRLSLWRGLAAGGFAVAAVSLAALFVTLNAPAPLPPAPPVVAVTPPPPPARMTPASLVVSLRHDDGTMAYTATVDADTGVITLIPASMPEDARVPELWLIPADGVPRSLGVVARDHAQRVVIPEQIRADAAADTTFAVSLEPEGGSPSGAPTGPVVASGKLIRL